MATTERTALMGQVEKAEAINVLKDELLRCGMKTVTCFQCRADSGIAKMHGFTKVLIQAGWYCTKNFDGTRYYCKSCYDRALAPVLELIEAKKKGGIEKQTMLLSGCIPTKCLALQRQMNDAERLETERDAALVRAQKAETKEKELKKVILDSIVFYEHLHAGRPGGVYFDKYKGGLAVNLRAAKRVVGDVL